jgi:hypothetical protein
MWVNDCQVELVETGLQQATATQAFDKLRVTMYRNHLEKGALEPPAPFTSV